MERSEGRRIPRLCGSWNSNAVSNDSVRHIAEPWQIVLNASRRPRPGPVTVSDRSPDGKALRGGHRRPPSPSHDRRYHCSTERRDHGRRFSRRSTWRGLRDAARIPGISLATVSGESRDLRQLARSGGAVVFVLSPDDCLGCANFTADVRVMRREFPHLAISVIGSGKATAQFQEYFRRSRLGDVALVDPDRVFLRSLQLKTSGPIALVVDREGRVVLVDARSNHRVGRHPVSSMLRHLQRVLSPNPVDKCEEDGRVFVGCESEPQG